MALITSCNTHLYVAVCGLAGSNLRCVKSHICASHLLSASVHSVCQTIL